jgi:hypothetical protein
LRVIWPVFSRNGSTPPAGSARLPSGTPLHAGAETTLLLRPAPAGLFRCSGMEDASLFRRLRRATDLCFMLWSQIIRYVALAGQLALAVGLAALITLLLRYVISGM